MPDIPPKPILAVSACLLGQEVRFDGGHKHNRYMTSSLGEHFDFRPLCPEVGIGLGIPRKPIRLVSRAGDVRAVSVDDDTLDVTDALARWGREALPQLDDVCGYILKKDSPSCGMERVKVYSTVNRAPDKTGVGIHAAEVLKARPALPVEEEGRLMDPRLRENFVERVFVYHRWQNMLAAGLSAAALVEFHTRHKFIVLAHDEPGYRELGRLVAGAGKGDIETVAADYLAKLMAALRILSTPKTHANVLMHMMGYFKRELEPHDKLALIQQIEAHREGFVPLIVPVTLLNFFVSKYGNDYVEGQHYLQPHPRELMLRNHV